VSNCPAFSTNGALIPVSVLRRSLGAGEFDAAAGDANDAIGDAASARSIANRSVPARMLIDMEAPFWSHPVYAAIAFAILRRAFGIVHLFPSRSQAQRGTAANKRPLPSNLTYPRMLACAAG
jgi:hypothetical protein